ncbi:hypothetical protein SDJN03_04383, partial [Cucurbita argyrosperma subsp. sororia]
MELPEVGGELSSLKLSLFTASRSMPVLQLPPQQRSHGTTKFGHRPPVLHENLAVRQRDDIGEFLVAIISENSQKAPIIKTFF